MDNQKVECLICGQCAVLQSVVAADAINMADIRVNRIMCITCKAIQLLPDDTVIFGNAVFGYLDSPRSNERWLPKGGWFSHDDDPIPF